MEVLQYFTVQTHSKVLKPGPFKYKFSVIRILKTFKTSNDKKNIRKGLTSKKTNETKLSNVITIVT